MNLTKYQRELLDYYRSIRVLKCSVFKEENAIAYTYKDKFYYKIKMDISLFKQDKTKLMLLILLHELGHIELGHMDESIKESTEFVYKTAESLGISRGKVDSHTNGCFGVINVCMDMEVNEALFTPLDIKFMTDLGFTPCTSDLFKLDYQSNWRDYVKPYLEMMKDKLDQVVIAINDIGCFNLKGDLNQSGSGDGGSKSNKDRSGSKSDRSKDDSDKDKDENGSGSGKDKNDSDKDKKGSGSGKGESNSDKPDSLEDGISVESLVNSIEIKAEEDKSCGSGSGNKLLEVDNQTDLSLREFFMSMMKPTRISYIDSFKHYNRGTRKNPDGLLYHSMKSKIKRKPKKLGILVDVSGSMKTDSLLKVLRSLRSIFKELNPESILVTWEEHLVNKYSITELPSKIRTGGGTDMASGLRYLNEKENVDIAVIYSDFVTDLDDLYEESAKCKCELNFIKVNNTQTLLIKDQEVLVKRILDLTI